jgi:HAD superfamily hydrolase (TIGR01509 family)
LCERVKGLSESRAAELVDALCAVEHPASTRQQTDQLVMDVIRRCDLAGLVVPAAAIAAMCLPAAGHVEFFPGAHRLLTEVSRHARVVIVSNTMWRGRQAVRRDFGQFGLAGHVSDYLMSIDVGWRKPDHRFFAAALAAGGTPPHQCVIVGDSETNDIEPARTLGMGTVRAAIEVPGPSTSAADDICTSLGDVADVLLVQLARRAR